MMVTSLVLATLIQRLLPDPDLILNSGTGRSTGWSQIPESYRIYSETKILRAGTQSISEPDPGMGWLLWFSSLFRYIEGTKINHKQLQNCVSSPMLNHISCLQHGGDSRQNLNIFLETVYIKPHRQFIARELEREKETKIGWGSEIGKERWKYKE